MSRAAAREAPRASSRSSPFTISPATRDPDVAAELARPARGDRPRRRDRQAARPAVPPRLPRRRRQGEGAQDRRLRRRRRPLEGEADHARHPAPRPLPRGRRPRLRRLVRRSPPAATTRSSQRIKPLLEGAPDRGFSEPNRWGSGELEESALQPEARRRGALRQGAGQPLPPRHAADPLPRRQGTGAVHVARGPPSRPVPSDLTVAGASSPSASKRETRLTFRRHMPAVRSPTFVDPLPHRLQRELATGRSAAPRPSVSGADARASGRRADRVRARRSSGRARSGRSRRTRRCRSATFQVVVATSWSSIRRSTSFASAFAKSRTAGNVELRLDRREDVQAGRARRLRERRRGRARPSPP